MNELPLRVIKIGGSLLSSLNLGERLIGWLDTLSPARNLLIVGGGRAVDLLRAKNAANLISKTTSHWLAIGCMETTAKQVAEGLPEVPLVSNIASLSSSFENYSTVIFSPTDWLRKQEPQLPGLKLEIGWHVTSDAIAARLAIALNASELILLKSADPPKHCSTQTPAVDSRNEHVFNLEYDVADKLNPLAKAGYIDTFFIQLVKTANKQLAISFVKLDE